MKARELAKLLLEHPDFEVKASSFKEDGSEWGMTIKSFKVNSVIDIGYADQVIVLDLKEEI